MDYVDLHRHFRPIDAERPFELSEWEALGFGLERGLDWPTLLARPRVVVLAEAAAGKTMEFKAQRDRLKAKGEFALYLTIEALSDRGLDRSLSREEAGLLAAWRRSTAIGWFFLDSVDEARINSKDVEAALNGFARDLELSYTMSGRHQSSCKKGALVSRMCRTSASNEIIGLVK